MAQASRPQTKKSKSQKPSPVSTQFAPKMHPGQEALQHVELVANIWCLIPSKNISIYRYDIRILEEFPPRDDGTVNTKEITKQTREDFPSIERKNKCVEIYLQLIKREAAFFGPMDALVYDRASILYTLDKLNIQKDETKTFTLTPNELPQGTLSDGCVRVSFNVQPCSEDFQLSMNDLKDDMRNRSRNLQQFFDILASQQAFFAEGAFVSYGTGESYLYDPFQFGFTERDMPELPDGKYIGIGASKGVKLIEGPNGPGHLNAALVLDVKKAAFHIEQQSVVEKVAAILNRSPNELNTINESMVSNLKKILRGLYVRCNYDKQRVFPIHNITPRNAKQLTFNTPNGTAISVLEYYKKYKGIALKFAQLPLIVEKRQQAENFYPMEVLTVCENQRVKQTQQTAQQVQAMIKACATAPSIRLQQTTKMVNAMNLGNDKNQWFDEFGMKINDKMKLDGRILPPPQIEYASNATVTVDPARPAWNARNMFLYPAECRIWCAAALVCATERYFTRQKFDEYIRAFVRHCRQHGMRINDPAEKIYQERATERDVDRIMAKARQIGATFVHFITSDPLSLHDHMKLVEAQMQIVTQDMKTRTATSASTKRQTLENIVNKTNLKLGGINYGLRLAVGPNQQSPINSNCLIVGIDIAHPVGGIRSRKTAKNAAPSIVGYSSNCKQCPFEFVGGYRYAEANQEEITDQTITDLMIESIEKFKNYHRNAPAHLYILRDGVSEGQYDYINRVEVQQVKNACSRIGQQENRIYHPFITFIVVTKLHNVRLYAKKIQPNDKPAQQNIKPGTVVDQRIVSPSYNEFYLQSHSAFQGTAKTPRYTVLFNTAKVDNDEIQALVYALAYDHQIVNAPISLPAPVMIASHMAKRGQNNFAARFGEPSESSDRGDNDIPNIKALNADLGYMDKPLSDCRFNA